MWRSSKRLVASCAQFFIRCGRRSDIDLDDLDDISDDTTQDVPQYFHPGSLAVPLQSRQEDPQHRPDAPGIRRSSPPEVVSKMRRALEEMGQIENPLAEKTRGDDSWPLPLTSSSGREQPNWRRSSQKTSYHRLLKKSRVWVNRFARLYQDRTFPTEKRSMPELCRVSKKIRTNKLSVNVLAGIR